MAPRRANRRDLDVIRGVLSYQFSYAVARAFTTPEDGVFVEYSSTGRIRYVWLDGERVLTRRAGDGLFSLSALKAGEIVLRAEAHPRFRLVVKDPSMVKGSVLAANVADVDPGLRAGDEVVIVDLEGRLVGVGRLRVSPSLALSLLRGEVARVRKTASWVKEGLVEGST